MAKVQKFKVNIKKCSTARRILNSRLGVCNYGDINTVFHVWCVTHYWVKTLFPDRDNILAWTRHRKFDHSAKTAATACLLRQSKVVICSLRVHAEKIVQSVVQETLSLFKASCFRFENRQGILRRKRFIFSYLCWSQNWCLILFFSVLRKWLFLVSEWAESLNAFCLGNQNWKPDKMYLHL